MNERIKVNDGKAGVHSEVTVAREQKKIVIQAKVAFSKRSLKYLTKKFLKKQELRDFIRVVADSKNSYELRCVVSTVSSIVLCFQRVVIV